MEHWNGSRDQANVGKKGLIWSYYVMVVINELIN